MTDPQWVAPGACARGTAGHRAGWARRHHPATPAGQPPAGHPRCRTPPASATRLPARRAARLGRRTPRWSSDPASIPLRPLTLGDLYGAVIKAIRGNVAATMGLAFVTTLIFLVPTTALGAWVASPASRSTSTASSRPTQLPVAGTLGTLPPVARHRRCRRSCSPASSPSSSARRVMGRKVTAGQTWEGTRGRLLAVVGATIVAGLAIIGGARRGARRLPGRRCSWPRPAAAATTRRSSAPIAARARRPGRPPARPLPVHPARPSSPRPSSSSSAASAPAIAPLVAAHRRAASSGGSSASGSSPASSSASPRQILTFPLTLIGVVGVVATGRPRATSIVMAGRHRRAWPASSPAPSPPRSPPASTPCSTSTSGSGARASTCSSSRGPGRRRPSVAGSSRSPMMIRAPRRRTAPRPQLARGPAVGASTSSPRVSYHDRALAAGSGSSTGCRTCSAAPGSGLLPAVGRVVLVVVVVLAVVAPGRRCGCVRPEPSTRRRPGAAAASSTTRASAPPTTGAARPRGAARGDWDAAAARQLPRAGRLRRGAHPARRPARAHRPRGRRGAGSRSSPHTRVPRRERGGASTPCATATAAPPRPAATADRPTSTPPSWPPVRRLDQLVGP